MASHIRDILIEEGGWKHHCRTQTSIICINAFLMTNISITYFHRHVLIEHFCRLFMKHFLEMMKSRSSSLLFDVRCSTFTYLWAKNGVRTGNICTISRILPVETQSLFSAFVFLWCVKEVRAKKKVPFYTPQETGGVPFLAN